MSCLLWHQIKFYGPLPQIGFMTNLKYPGKQNVAVVLFTPNLRSNDSAYITQNSENYSISKCRLELHTKHFSSRYNLTYKTTILETRREKWIDINLKRIT